LLAGLYSMQQRAHIRIYLLYDLMPRNVQRLCDTVTVVLIIAFTFVMIWGGFTEAYSKLMRWETFGTAFDPPIPATMKPLILLVITLVSVQALLNLINDWHKGPEVHAVVDEGEIEEFVQEMGAKLKDKV
ncbi:MAG: TRAP transporter small permease, partial [Paracoccaceae bacterium]|nr:TRAP transporter small permease [Paracoccaceae bacterium]